MTIIRNQIFNNLRALIEENHLQNILDAQAFIDTIKADIKQYDEIKITHAKDTSKVLIDELKDKAFTLISPNYANVKIQRDQQQKAISASGYRQYVEYLDYRLVFDPTSRYEVQEQRLSHCHFNSVTNHPILSFKTAYDLMLMKAYAERVEVHTFAVEKVRHPNKDNHNLMLGVNYIKYKNGIFHYTEQNNVEVIPLVDESLVYATVMEALNYEYADNCEHLVRGGL